MANDKKELKVGDRTYTIRMPSVVEIQEADMEYSKAFNAAIRNGIMPRNVLKQNLQKEDIWTPEDEQTSAALRQTLDNLLEDLASKQEVENEQDFNDVRSQVAFARATWFVHEQKLNELLRHCAENRAEDAKLFYLVHLCTEDEKGQRVWKTYKEFRSEKNNELVNNAALQLMYLSTGFSEDIESNLVENQIKWLGKPKEDSEAKSTDISPEPKVVQEYKKD